MKKKIKSSYYNSATLRAPTAVNSKGKYSIKNSLFCHLSKIDKEMPFPRKKGAQSTSIEIRSQKKPTRKAPLFLKISDKKTEN